MKMKFKLVLGTALLLVSGCANQDDQPVDLTGTKNCPPWVEYPADNHSNAPSPYLGCINHENLVNMLADPADLEQGRPLGPESGAREIVILKDYDQNKSAVFKDPNAPTSVSAATGTTGSSGQ